MIRCFVQVGALAVLFTLGLPLAAEPIKPAPRNPYVFERSNGQSLVLIGAYTWGTFSGVDYDYEAYTVALFPLKRRRGPCFSGSLGVLRT